VKTVDLSRFQRSRESTVEAGGHVFTLRRPAALDVVRARAAGAIDLDFAFGYVVGWNLKESDLLPGGDPVEAGFDPALFSAWLRDRPDFWDPLTSAVIDAYNRYEESRADRGNA